ncbi:adenosine receptor A2b-like [Actinia tenebrosa]|uniref:Adenosine receptor A2b-like n=1 Tax=Actinia tenebrosa TaxID=6105 RepID=A0A6P8HN49_ACTTE|nr:adenosine receptor A2b-like [Actinia tenebrosa]
MNLPTSTCISIINLESKNIVRSHYLALCACNSILAIPTAVANTLVIVAILTTPYLQTPSYLLLTSLAFSDVAVGFIGQPVFVAAIGLFMDGEAEKYCNVRTVSGAILIVLTMTSVLTVTAISVDRYLAIRLKIRYKVVVTSSRTRILVVFLWIFSFASLLAFPFNIDISVLVLLGGIGLLLCLIVILCSYSMSFRSLTIHCAQIQPTPTGELRANSTTPVIDVLKYKKLFKTMLFILAVIFICYLPMIGVFAILSRPNPNRAAVWGFQTIVCLNSTLNPFIYMTRVRDIRQACMRIVRRIICC